jgi:hypothetical protein
MPSDKATPIAGVAAVAMPSEKAVAAIANDVYRCTILSDPDNKFDTNISPPASQ